MAPVSEQKIIVCTALHKKKFGFIDVLKAAGDSRNVEFFSSDIFEDEQCDLPFIGKKKAHVLLHKVTGEMVEANADLPSKEQAARALDRLHDIVSETKCVEVDSRSDIEPLVRRTTMWGVIRKIESRAPNLVKAPRQRTLCGALVRKVGESANTLLTTVDGAKKLQSLLFALEKGSSSSYIVKTSLACGTSDSHKMALVKFTPDSAVATLPKMEGAMLANPSKEEDEWDIDTVVAQEYVSHGSSFLKVYVIGDQVTVQVRRTLRFEEDEGGTANAICRVNSADIGKQPGQFLDATDSRQAKCEDVAKVIRGETGLGLFGFDLLEEDGTDKLVLVDINYFPGYKGVPGVADAIIDYVLTKLAISEERANDEDKRGQKRRLSLEH